MASPHLLTIQRKPCQELESGFGPDLNQSQTIPVDSSIYLALLEKTKQLTSTPEDASPTQKFYHDVTGEQ